MEMKHGPIYFFPKVADDLPMTISPIGINYCHSNYKNVRLNSKITVLGCVLNGQGRITVDANTYRPKQGDVFILPKGHYHEVTVDPMQEEQWTYIWFNIEGDFVNELLSAYKILESGLVSNASVERLFKKAIQLAQLKSVQEMHNELPIIFHQIVLGLSNTKYDRCSPYSARVQKIKHWLDNNIQEPFDSDKLSKQIGMSFKQISRLFKKELDRTVYDYVLHQKIDLAKTMLHDSEFNISEICYQLGYADPHYFSNLFKKKTGISPSDYRVRHE